MEDMSRPPVVQQHILALLQAHHTLTAPEILDSLSKKDLRFNKTSVYRALDQLLEQAKVCRQTLGGDVPTYELRTHHHDHLICERCGSVKVVSCLACIPSEVEGFVIGHHHLTAYGICASCRVSSPEPEE